MMPQVAGEPVHVPSRADALLQRLVPPGTLLGGRYLPRSVLGQGGMGVVARALDTRLDREVAIKWLLPELARDPSLVARFASEATALARIHHPNVVQILDVADGDRIYYVMELVPGEPLVRRLRERGRMPWPLAFDVLLQTGSALAAVHAAGLVHRDVKPSNVLCTEVGPESLHVEIIDFGIARTIGTPRLTMPGEMIGTLPYMAPEQLAGLEGDPRTDVYGWGVLALELLGGIAPAQLFGSESMAGAPLRDAAPRVLAEARVQPRIAAIVRGCLAVQPGDRWADMGEVTQRLHALDDGGAPTLIYRRERPPRIGTTLVPGTTSDETNAGAPRLAEEIGATDEQQPTPIAATGEQVPAVRYAVTQRPDQRVVAAPSAPKPSRWVAPGIATIALLGAGSWWALDRARSVAEVPSRVAAPPREPSPIETRTIRTDARIVPAPIEDPPPPIAPLDPPERIVPVDRVDADAKSSPRPASSRPRSRELPPRPVAPTTEPLTSAAEPAASEARPRPPKPRPGRDLKDPFR
jgi:serine/threonine-protein kinase